MFCMIEMELPPPLAFQPLPEDYTSDQYPFVPLQCWPKGWKEVSNLIRGVGFMDNIFEELEEKETYLHYCKMCKDQEAEKDIQALIDEINMRLQNHASKLIPKLLELPTILLDASTQAREYHFGTLWTTLKLGAHGNEPVPEEFDENYIRTSFNFENEIDLDEEQYASDAEDRFPEIFYVGFNQAVSINQAPQGSQEDRDITLDTFLQLEEELL